jgi:hypothetical protein
MQPIMQLQQQQASLLQDKLQLQVLQVLQVLR